MSDSVHHQFQLNVICCFTLVQQRFAVISSSTGADVLQPIDTQCYVTACGEPTALYVAIDGRAQHIYTTEGQNINGNKNTCSDDVSNTL